MFPIVLFFYSLKRLRPTQMGTTPARLLTADQAQVNVVVHYNGIPKGPYLIREISDEDVTHPLMRWVRAGDDVTWYENESFWLVGSRGEETSLQTLTISSPPPQTSTRKVLVGSSLSMKDIEEIVAMDLSLPKTIRIYVRVAVGHGAIRIQQKWYRPLKDIPPILFQTKEITPILLEDLIPIAPPLQMMT